MEITSAKDITKDSTTYLLYAAPGIGKTSTLRYLPGKTLVIDIDKTSHVLQGEEQIDVLNFDTHNAWTGWDELIKWLNTNDLSQWDNLVIDNVSELWRAMLAEAGRTGKNKRVPEMAHYQRMDFYLMDSVRFLKSLKKRLVFLAWEMTDEWTTQEGQTFNRSYPQLRDKTITNFMGLCDVVGRLEYNPKSGKRFFFLQPSNEMFAKNQLDARKHCLQQDVFKIGHDSEAGEEG